MPSLFSCLITVDCLVNVRGLTTRRVLLMADNQLSQISIKQVTDHIGRSRVAALVVRMICDAAPSLQVGSSSHVEGSAVGRIEGNSRVSDASCYRLNEIGCDRRLLLLFCLQMAWFGILPALNCL